jgi:hypothetical protein
MKKNLFLIAIIVSLIACQRDLMPEAPSVTPAMPPAQSHEFVWSVYDADPDHPWNRVFRQLYRRTISDGEEYGADELDPLLWFDTTHLLNGESHQQAIRVLDEFVAINAENLIDEPLKRAMFQRDLWAVFDWLASQAEPHPAEREALKASLADIMKRVALPAQEIQSLPDNYTLVVDSGVHPTGFQADHPEQAFLPSDLFQPDSAWVPMGREGGPVAMTHTEAFPFFGRSVFLVFVRSSDGRGTTLNFIESLSTEANPVTAIGSDAALVRRMLLIDNQGELVLSPLVETIQIRHFSPAQSFYEFELDRARLFDDITGGLVPNDDLFMLFMSHGDVFESPDIPDLRAKIPEICKACHFEDTPIPNSGNTYSIISYSRQPFSLPDNARPVLFATTLEEEAKIVMEWKRDHETWKALETLWDKIR